MIGQKKKKKWTKLQQTLANLISKAYWFYKQWQTGAIRKRKLQENRNLDRRSKQQHTSQKSKKKVKGNRKEGWKKNRGNKINQNGQKHKKIYQPQI